MNGSDLHFSTSSPSPEPTDASTVPGQLVVVSGPSGVGKSTIVEGLRTSWPFHFSVSVTTRPAREHERDGVDYRFVTREEFTNLIEAGALLEWAEYAEHLYGTPRAAVVDTLAIGTNVLLDIEVNGAVQVMQAYPEALTIFIKPPSLEVLKARLRGREDTGEYAIEGRLAVAEMQMAVGEDRFDYQVVNDAVETAIDRIVRILTAPNPPYSEA